MFISSIIKESTANSKIRKQSMLICLYSYLSISQYKKIIVISYRSLSSHQFILFFVGHGDDESSLGGVRGAGEGLLAVACQEIPVDQLHHYAQVPDAVDVLVEVGRVQRVLLVNCFGKQNLLCRVSLQSIYEVTLMLGELLNLLRVKQAHPN
jgi:hypothetical protein